MLRRRPKYNFETPPSSRETRDYGGARNRVPKYNLGTSAERAERGSRVQGVGSRVCAVFIIAAVLAAVSAFAENYNGNNASLNLTTTDLSSSAAQSNSAGGRLVSAGTPGAGVVSINGVGAKGIFEPMSALAGTKGVSADFSASPLSGAAPLEVQFTDLSIGGLYVIQSWSWDFGDETSASSEQNPKHTYEDPGSYTVTLTITVANDALSKTKTDYITVANGVPAANYGGLLLLVAVLAVAGGINAKRRFSTTKYTK